MGPKIRLERRSLGEQITDLVRNMILDGDFAPGERLVEEQLAEMIGASRTPVREALHRLEQEKLLMKRPTGGYEVRPLTSKEVEEVVGVRAALESYAVELASTRLTSRLVAKLTKNVDQFEEALARDDKAKLVELNTAFHEMLYQAADSGILKRLITEMHEVLHRFRVALLSEPHNAAQSLTDHRRLLEALSRGEAQEAAAICKEHVLAGGHRILSLLEEKPKRGEEP